MIALVLSSAWPSYYASSPFLNLLNSSHPDFIVFKKLPHETADLEFQEAVSKCEALVVDDVLSQHMGFYKNGPKLMVGGDPHAHKRSQVERLEKEYASVDFVLTGAVFSKKLKDRYLYPPDELWDKHIYFPHMVPDYPPPSTDWSARIPRALMSGSSDPLVYPYRDYVKTSGHSSIDILQMSKLQHSDYFKLLSTYIAAVTCNSNFKYTVAKYFEIPWLGTLLIAAPPSFEETELIGLQHLQNCVFSHWSDVLRSISLWTSTSMGARDTAGKMAKEGAELMKLHTANRRLDYVKLLVERIKKGGFKPEDAKDCFLNHRKEGESARVS